jgi:tRNA A-37 threonylcarbamoyl transferase component Bud32/membrane-associated phospholipid phosphatase
MSASVATPSVPAQIVRTRKRRRPSGEPPPLPRQLNASGKWWLVLAAATIGTWILASTVGAVSRGMDRIDHAVLTWFESARTPGLTGAMKAAGLLASSRGIQVVWLSIALVLLVSKRWRHLFVLIGSTWLVDAITSSAQSTIMRPRPVGIEIIGPWQGFALPSRPLALLATMLIGALYAVVPAGRFRNIGKWAAAGVLLVIAATRLYLGQEGPTDALFGIVIGVAVPLALFRMLAPNDVFPVTYNRRRGAHLDVTGRRGTAIVNALHDQLGVIATEIKPFGLEGSGGSTPLRVKVKGDPDTFLFCKLYAINHVRSDRWYKLGRTLLYGRLEDEAAFNSVRRLVQYEDYLLRLLQAARLPVPTPYGIVEITPDREYLLVTEFFDGAQEIGVADVDDTIIEQGLSVVRQMWDAGLAHRDIKPANLLVCDGRLLVIDSAFAEVRPSPWRQAVDLGNMMLVLALRSDTQRVYDAARRYFNEHEIAEAFAATRGLTMPSQLRRMMRQRGRDLHAEFTALLPFRLPPVKIQRWSVRRVMLTIAATVGALVTIALALTLLSSPL